MHILRRFLSRVVAMPAARSAHPPVADTPSDHAQLSDKLSWNGPSTSGERFLSVFMDQNNNGGTKEIFESIRVGARFKTVINNFLLVARMKRERNAALPILRINHVLSEPNIDQFDDFLRLVEDLAPGEISVRTVSRMSDAVIQESSDPLFWEKVRSAREKLAAFCQRTGIVDSAYLRDRPTLIELFTEQGGRLTCRRPWDTLAIHPNGDVYPCMA
ncbi:MAG: hypothetical protein ABIO78_02730 [Thermoanaerobaculia bacterium]